MNDMMSYAISFLRSDWYCDVISIFSCPRGSSIYLLEVVVVHHISFLLALPRTAEPLRVVESDD